MTWEEADLVSKDPAVSAMLKFAASMNVRVEQLQAIKKILEWGVWPAIVPATPERPLHATACIYCDGRGYTNPEEDPAPEGYHIEVENAPCDKCACGETYRIVGPGDIGTGTIYEDLGQAEDVMDDLNHAFYLGRESAKEKPHVEYQVLYSPDGNYHIPDHAGDTIKILRPEGE